MSDTTSGTKSLVRKTERKPVKKSKEGKRRFHPIQTIRDVTSELKKVSWPTRGDLVQHTIVVVVFVLVFAAVVGIIDFGLSFVYRLILGY